MKNIVTKIEGNRLILEIDLSANPSASGKSTLIATPGGNKPVTGRPNMRLGLIVFQYAPKYVQT